MTRGPALSQGRTIAYRITTALVAAELGVGGVWDIRRIRYVRAIMTHLGYPDYFTVLIGLWKVPAAAALLVPGPPRLKEWAYAGAVYTYTGAVASHLAVGDGAHAVAAPLVFTGLTAASWALRPPPCRTPAPGMPRTGSAGAGARRRTAAYRVTTAVLATECVVGGLWGILRLPPFFALMKRLGYPEYFGAIVGGWYLLGGVALLAPGLPRLKEWAYAGLVFHYTGAVASHRAAGAGAGALVAPLVFTGLTVASWALRPPDRREVAAD